MDLASLIREVPDFPVKGILFRDLTTLMLDAAAFRESVDALVRPYQGSQVDVVAAIESRGFIFAGAVAYRLGAGFVPIRKPGKLPAETIRVEYSLEYGSNVLEIHRDAIKPGQRVLLVDDLLATGGSARAAVQLIERLGGRVVGVAFLVNLASLRGVDNLAGYDVYTVIDM
ncbi:MAG: adenine phosphoribosyltransferase [Anaerolineae bacterium]|nr:adenine phosphoribosyltransferase [Anaerolineae bacterium]